MDWRWSRPSAAVVVAAVFGLFAFARSLEKLEAESSP
jgi:hypothetical protein